MIEGSGGCILPLCHRLHPLLDILHTASGLTYDDIDTYDVKKYDDVHCQDGIVTFSLQFQLKSETGEISRKFQFFSSFNQIFTNVY